jgi:hypothetical protein
MGAASAAVEAAGVLVRLWYAQEVPAARPCADLVPAGV